jgi:hypothetical protein
MATCNPTLTPEALNEIIDQAVKGSSCCPRDTGKLQDDTRSKIVSASSRPALRTLSPSISPSPYQPEPF